MTERTSARVLVVGSINTDLVVRSRVLPGPGETVLGESFFKAGGGKGANQAVAAARAGAAVTFVGRVGQDDFGREARETFAKEGIDATWVTTDPGRPTGVALIVVDAEGQNSIAVAPGANGAITPQHIYSAVDAFSATDVCLVQLEIPLPAVSRAAQLAADHGVPVVLNPAPACELPPDLLKRTAVIVPNESETEYLTGIRPDSDASAAEAAARLLQSGVGSVILTLGDRGAIIADESGLEPVPAPDVHAVDTTAAGDAFCGALAASLASGKPLAQAVRFASCAGACAVTSNGAQPSLPQLADIENMADKFY